MFLKKGSGDIAVNMRRMMAFMAVVLCLFLFPQTVKASLVEITNDGYVKLNVLSATDEIALGMPKSDILSVKSAVSEIPNEIPTVSLASEGGRINLNVATNAGENNLDVTDFKGDVLEIEERPTIKKIAIAISEGKFLITQGTISALCEFPIEVNATDAKMTIKAPTGNRVVAVFPADAVESLAKAKILSRLNSNLLLSENEKGDLYYYFDGAKTLSFFGLFNINIPIKGSISAITGEVLSIEGLDWSKLINTFKIG